MTDAVLYFLRPLILTELFEFAAAYFLKIRNPKDYLLIGLVNAVTNLSPSLAILLIYRFIGNYWVTIAISYCVLEPIVFFIEYVYYKKWLTDKAGAFRYSLIMNLVSMTGGLLCQNIIF